MYQETLRALMIRPNGIYVDGTMGGAGHGEGGVPGNVLWEGRCGNQRRPLLIRISVGVAVGRGETAVGVAFLHDAVAEKAAGFPVTPGTPCEGTGYEIGSMSIIKGARNLDNAKKFYDWALTPAAQEIGAANKAFPIPSNKNAKMSPLMPKLSEVKLIDYDFAKYGSASERRRLLEKWEQEVNALPR